MTDARPWGIWHAFTGPREGEVIVLQDHEDDAVLATAFAAAAGVDVESVRWETVYTVDGTGWDAGEAFDTEAEARAALTTEADHG